MKYETLDRLVMTCLLAASPAWAAAPDPVEAKAVVPALEYKPAFEGYRRYAETPVESWKAVNDNVGRIGGWRVYLKESQQPDQSPVAPAAQPAPATPVKPVAPRGQHAH